MRKDKPDENLEVAHLLDQSVPSGVESSLEALAYASRKLKSESNRNRAKIARTLKDAFYEFREDRGGGEDERERERVVELCETFCEEFLELLKEEEKEKEREEENDGDGGAKSASTLGVEEEENQQRRDELREALTSMRKDARVFHELEEKLELKQLHLEMLREENMFEECLKEVERMVDEEEEGGGKLSNAYEMLERSKEEYACVEIPNERIDDLMVKLQDAIRRRIAGAVSVSDDGGGVALVEFSNARDAWKASRAVSETLFRECAVFVTRKVVDEIVVPFVQSRARNVELSVNEENGYAKTLKWEKGETAGKGDDEEDGMISTFVQGLDVLLFKGIFTKQSFALDELSSDLVDVARGVFWPTVSKTCIQTWNLGSKQALLTDDDVDSVVALERRVASLGLLNSYGLGSALDTVAGPLEIAAMQGEIESRLDFRVNSLASARDAGKTPAISDELLQTKAKEEEVKGNGEDSTSSSATTTKYCEEFFELHCFELPASRTITSSAVQLLNVTKSAFHSVLSSSFEDKENAKDANTPAGRKRHAIAAIKTACDCLEAFRCSRMSTRDESIFKQSLFESLVFYNDCGFIADQFIAQSLDAAKALENLVRKDNSGGGDDNAQQHRPAILWAVEALRDAGDAVFERAERNASVALEESLDSFANETQSIRGANASAMKKSIAISRDVLKKFCSAASQTLQRTNAKRIVGKFCESYASRIVSAIKEMHDISADDAGAFTDALEDAFTPLQLGTSSVEDDFFYDALENWQKGSVYAKLLKTKLREITDMYTRGELKMMSENEVLAFISACFADTPLREECFERIENM